MHNLRGRQLNVTVKVLSCSCLGANMPTFKTGSTAVIFFLHLSELGRHGVLHVGRLTLHNFKDYLKTINHSSFTF